VFEEGSLTLVYAAVALFAAGLVFERVVTTKLWLPYFKLGAVLRPELVPIHQVPEGEGRTASVCWSIVRKPTLEDASAWGVFWADPGRRAAPSGLHGAVHFLPTHAGVRLEVRWCVPWTPLVALAWLVAIGAARGELLLTTTVAALLAGAVVVVYRAAAIRAAAELRWHFVQSGTDEG
jgi:hypothetical protein